MSDSAISEFLTEAASTKRLAGGGGQTQAPVANLSSVRCTPVLPLSSDTLMRLKLDAPYLLREVYVGASYDIREGDYLTVGDLDYKIKNTQLWDAFGIAFMQLIVEEQKRKEIKRGFLLLPDGTSKFLLPDGASKFSIPY